jgi:hypothetical protein
MLSKGMAALIAVPLVVIVAAIEPGFAAEGRGDAKKNAKAPNIDRAKKVNSPAADGVVLAQIADQLITHGDKNKDSIALITAARIQSQIGVQFQKAEKTSGGKPPADAQDAKGTKSGGQDHTTVAVLERAKQYAGGRKDLIALADEAAKSGTRGAVRVPRMWQEHVLAGQIDVYTISFRGGELARFAISGDGDTDLDLIINDEYGNVICKAEGPTDDEMCSWVPKFTGPSSVQCLSPRPQLITSQAPISNTAA